MPPTPKPPGERFWKFVNKTDSCWLWQGALDRRGYGVFNRGDRVVRAHRMAVELMGRDAGLELDHLCRTPACVRPDHLEAVSHRENMLRAETSLPAIALAKTQCNSGHALIGDNMRIRRGRRECLSCVAIQRKKSNETRRRKRAAARRAA